MGKGCNDHTPPSSPTSVSEPRKEPKLNSLRVPEPKLSIAAPAPFYFSKPCRNLIEKIMVAEEIFVNCYNFNPVRVKHASIHIKRHRYSSQKGI
jgi:hypothetical protein